MIKALTIALFLAAIYQATRTHGEQGSVHAMRSTAFTLAAIVVLCTV